MRRFAPLLFVGALIALAGCTTVAPSTATGGTGGANAEWDAGNIVSDQVFYNSKAMTVGEIQSFLSAQGCSGACLANSSYSWTSQSVAWCSPVAAGSGSFAAMLATAATACGINPQVALVMIQKESQGLTRPPPAALTGFGCPDTGPGGSANCSAGSSGVWNQTWGMMQAFAHLKADPSRINYPVGKTSNILWNVAETGCGSTPVTVKNTATATLYTYTPYTPNAASLAAYPGEGDACSSYGNRNFFRMFQKYFGDTGGGKPVAPGPGAVNAALVNGVSVTIPDNQYVAPELRGRAIKAPTEQMAKGLAAGFGTLGTLYVWGGGFGPGGAATDGCARGGGDRNSCQGQIGWDCSGLTNYVYVQGGYPSPGGESSSQRAGGQSVSFEQGLPGDIVGFPGHVAIYLGDIGGQRYILEASDVGIPNHVVKLTRSDFDSSLHRYWGTSQV